MESKLQSEIIKFLKARGAYVIKTRPGPGIPAGCPDIIFLYEGFYGCLEVKASDKSPFQPGQEHTIKVLDDWSWCKVVYPENWGTIKAELFNLFF